MKQESINLIEFQNKFTTEETCRDHLFRLRWLDGYRCPRCGNKQSYTLTKRCLYQCKRCGYQTFLTAGTVFHKTRTPLRKWLWMIFLMSQQKCGVSMLSLQQILGIRSYKSTWVMGHKTRKAMADRNAHYKLAGLIEMDDSYLGAPRTGKRGRGAGGKAKVIVAVENRGTKAGFATMCQVEQFGTEDLHHKFQGKLGPRCRIRTDGSKAYGVFETSESMHEPVILGSGKNAAKLLLWVHTLISNIKGNIRGIYHGVSLKHLKLYLPEFCYRFNRRFWESQLFDRLLKACLCTTSITLSELRA